MMVFFVSLISGAWLLLVGICDDEQRTPKALATRHREPRTAKNRKETEVSFRFLRVFKPPLDSVLRRNDHGPLSRGCRRPDLERAGTRFRCARQGAAV